jgi:hypothetical protein
MLQVEEASLVELDLSLTVPLELDAERCVADDSLVLAAFAVEDFGGPLLGALSQSCALGGLQTTNESPTASLIVSLFPRLAVMSKIDVAFLSKCFVKSDSRNTRLEESYSKR